jgi:sigma-B regulation protein RsbU (phosphoserine phosphatase)
VERQRTQEQLKVARQIQLSLTPRQLPEIPGLSVGTEYRAAQEVGGDYFDFYRIDHDHLGVLVLDVAGKGVPGALLMAITGTFLKMAAPRDRSPAWVLNEVNAALSAEISRGLYVTAVYGVLQISTRQFTLCSAGHPEVIVVRERDLSCEPHKPRGAALGMLRPNHFRAVLGQEIIQLEPGDTLLLYTDGVLEAMNDKGEEFGWDRLCRVAQRTARKGPRTLTSEIAKSVAKHAGAEPQYDDITVVALGIDIESASPDAAQEPE